MQRSSIFSLGTKVLVTAAAAMALVIGCKKDEPAAVAPQPQLAGAPGNPRFNLQFTNPDKVDLDLYVKTPAGTTIYYGRKSANGGTLDVDCLCTNCPNGPNENIYWVPGTAPTGQYEFWVEYYSSCGGSSGATSDFTLRVVNNNTIVQTYTGTLSSSIRSSTRYTRTY